MPIPRVLLHRIKNPVPPHESDIIDGQQRCTILRDFRGDEFALTADTDQKSLHGKFYKDLPERLREAFDSYEVPIDEYRHVGHREIRQVFRRLNYYTAPLNAAEQRHAQFYGELCSFVERQCDAWRETFEQLRVFTKKQFRRKADQQLMAEIVDAMLNGIGTPTAASLRNVYATHERGFSSGPDFARRLDMARVRISRWKDLRKSRLRKHYQMFSLVLAVMHGESNVPALKRDLGKPKPIRLDHLVLKALEPLDGAVKRKIATGTYAAFWKATHEKTNVRENRLRRCKYFYAAITGRR